MDFQELEKIAGAIVADGKGILAADESSGTIKKRFDSIGVESTEETRRAYRELLFTTEGAEEFIGGVILYDETIRQQASDGTPFPKLLESKGIVPGIKVDTGAKPLALAEGETVTEGLDGLRERLAEYRELGARFAKWRAVITIGKDIPSEYCIWTNAHALARYAALCQEGGLVPIVEPEVLMDGDHTIERSFQVTSHTLHAVFTELRDQRIHPEGILLKPNMVLPGYESSEQVSDEEIARPDSPMLPPARAGSCPGNRVPVGWTVGGGSDTAAQRDQCHRPAPVEGVVLVRACPAGGGPEGLGRSRRERRGCAARLLPPRQDEQRGGNRSVRAGDGERGRSGLGAHLYSRPVRTSSLSSRCVASIRRDVPDRERITIESVIAPFGR